MTSIKPFIKLQVSVDKAGAKINKHLTSSLRKKFQAEVDMRPPLALPSTMPTREQEMIASNRLREASFHVEDARKALAKLNDTILTGQGIPLLKEGEENHKLSTSLPEGWEEYNDKCISLAEQRDLYQNAIDQERNEVSIFANRISSGAEATSFLQRLSGFSQSTRNLLPKPPGNNNTSQDSQNQTSSNATQGGNTSFGFRF